MSSHVRFVAGATIDLDDAAEWCEERQSVYRTAAGTITISAIGSRPSIPPVLDRPCQALTGCWNEPGGDAAVGDPSGEPLGEPWLKRQGWNKKNP